MKLINDYKKWLPITKVTVEIGAFDIQKIMNPEISGKEYQQGSLYEYNNLKAYLFAREQGKCQFCGKKIDVGQKVNLHHIIPRAEGGTDKPDNRALLHDDCHKKLHKEKLFNNLKKAKQYKEATYMSIVAKKFPEVLDCGVTYGYETKTKRKLLGLEKSHVNDAFIIAGGTDQVRCIPFKIEQKRINNRTLQTNRKGFKPSIRRQKHKIQNRDFVWIGSKKYLCGGVFSKGSQVYYFDNEEKKLIGIKKIEKVYHTRSLVWI